MDRERLIAHRLRNLFQSVLLLGGMAALLALMGWTVGGVAGLVWMAVLGLVALVVGSRVSPRIILPLLGARALSAYEAPTLAALVRELARRAELEVVPRLYYLPIPVMQAFTTGRPDDSAITVSDGLIRRLTLRELAGVLAHEVSHIRHYDTWILLLADVVTRLTRALAFVGMLLVVVNLPLVMMGTVHVPWAFVFLLVFAPAISMLLQLALSRAREYDADLGAAALTGDPAGLAAALVKLERAQTGFWESLLMPGRRAPEPSFLRTHPETEERVRRLTALEPRRPLPADLLAAAFILPEDWPMVRRRPPWWYAGLWR
jgi:heat shock protein HtpX